MATRPDYAAAFGALCGALDMRHREAALDLATVFEDMAANPHSIASHETRAAWRLCAEGLRRSTAGRAA